MELLIQDYERYKIELSDVYREENNKLTEMIEEVKVLSDWYTSVEERYHYYCERYPQRMIELSFLKIYAIVATTAFIIGVMK